MMNVAKGVGGLLLGAVGLVVIFVLPVALMWGGEWVSDHLVVPAIVLSEWTLTICLLILLPLAIFRWTRMFAANGIFVASFIFGATVWMAGFLTTLDYWGWFGVAVGMFLIGFGVVPIGIVGALFHASWTEAGMLAFGLALTFGCRFMTYWLFDVQERSEQRRAANLSKKLVAQYATHFD
jgi:hypothetical protein